MGAIKPSKIPGGTRKKRRDDTDFTEYKKGGNVSLPGLYDNINAKKKRIATGSGEKMRKPGSKGSPSNQDFINSLKTAKK
jgi:hypothetical protein